MAHFDEIQRNLRYAVRTFGRNRLLTCAVVLTLVIGVGLNGAIFSVVNGMVFRARVEKDPQSFVQVLTNGATSTSLADYRKIESSGILLNTSAWTVVHTTIDDSPRDNLAMLVTCNFFSLYGLDTPKLGRTFQRDDCTKPVTIVSEELWKRDFHSDPQIIGRPILLNHHPYTVIGLAPAGFSGRLRGGGIWIPYTMQSDFFAGTDLFAADRMPWLTVEGRSAPGHNSLAELTALLPDVPIALTDGSLIQHPSAGQSVKVIVPLVLGSFGLILLLACANVTMLLLSRAASRQREMAIRLSLGADRASLIRMLLTEGLALSAIAGAISFCLTIGVPTLFERIMWRAPHYIVQPDWRVFSYLALLTLLAGIITGLAPASESLKLNLTGSLKGSESHSRTRDLLIAAQVAISLVLLIGGALFARAEFAMLSAQPNFETHRVLQVPLNTRAPFPATLEAQIKQLPGIRSTCYASLQPFSGKTPAEGPLNFISPNCFETLSIPIVQGAATLDADSLVVSQALARKLWPAQNPIGKTYLGKTVTGIARDLTYIRSSATDPAMVYQQRSGESPRDSLLVRIDNDPETAAQSISRLMLSLDPNQTNVPYTLSSRIDEMASRFSVIEGMVVVMGSVALILAVIGIYGVVGFAVLRRTKELGIRLALGATTADLLCTVVGPGLRPILIGMVTGGTLAALGSLGLKRIFDASPVAINATDPLPYVAVSVLLFTTAIAAMLIPGAKAAITIPAKSLRED